MLKRETNRNGQLAGVSEGIKIEFNIYRHLYIPRTGESIFAPPFTPHHSRLIIYAPPFKRPIRPPKGLP